MQTSSKYMLEDREREKERVRDTNSPFQILIELKPLQTHGYANFTCKVQISEQDVDMHNSRHIWCKYQMSCVRSIYSEHYYITHQQQEASW